MRPTAAGFVLTALATSLAPGQPGEQPSQERVFHFAYTKTPEGASEITTVIRVVSDIKQVQVSTESAPATLTVHGTADQMAVAEWLFIGLDQPTYGRPGPTAYEYRLPGTGENVVRVHYFYHADTVQNFQEIATVARTIVEIRRMIPYNAQRAVAMRGTGEQTALAEWLFRQMDKPANEPVIHSATNEYLMPDTRDEAVVRVFYAAHVGTAGDFQEFATLLRTIAEIRRLFTYTAPRAMAMRGAADEISLAEWPFNELDKPANGRAGALSPDSSPTHEYRIAGSQDDLVRVFYLAHAATRDDFQKIATQVRTATKIQRVFTYNAPRAMVLRGTVDQIELAERLITELDKPSLPRQPD